MDGGQPEMNRSAKGGTRSSLHYEGEGVLIHPPHQGVCGRHGTKERRVTSGGLAESPGGTGVSRPISVSEVSSDALPVPQAVRASVAARLRECGLELDPEQTKVVYWKDD